MLDKHSLVTIIDADTICWIVAYNAREEENVDVVLLAADSFVTNILASTSCTHYIGFLGGTKCFRHDVAVTKPYKANRPESPDWYKKWGIVIKAHLRDKWQFQVVNGIEADDAVSISATELLGLSINYIVAGADKDLDQIEGNHYNLRTHKRKYIDATDADRNLFKQVLLGDTADNIMGCQGIGPKKASQYIDGLTNKFEMAKVTYNLFENKYKDEGKTYREMLNLCELLSYGKPCWWEFHSLRLDYIEVPRNTDVDEVITELFG